MVIEEKVVKIKNQAEAERYYNYPYNALEEALVNAVFHKSYREGEAVEVRIYVDCILQKYERAKELLVHT